MLALLGRLHGCLLIHNWWILAWLLLFKIGHAQSWAADLSLEHLVWRQISIILDLKRIQIFRTQGQLLLLAKEVLNSLLLPVDPPSRAC